MSERPSNPYTIRAFPTITERGTVKCELYVAVPSSETIPDALGWSLVASLKPYLDQTRKRLQQVLSQAERETAQTVLTESFEPSFKLTEPGQILAEFDYSICESEVEFKAACTPGIPSAISVLPDEFVVVASSPSVIVHGGGKYKVQADCHTGVYLKTVLSAEKSKAITDALKTWSDLTRQSITQACVSKDYNRVRTIWRDHLERAMEQLKKDGTLPPIKTNVVDDPQTLRVLNNCLSVLGREGMVPI